MTRTFWSRVLAALAFSLSGCTSTLCFTGSVAPPADAAFVAGVAAHLTVTSLGRSESAAKNPPPGLPPGGLDTRDP